MRWFAIIAESFVICDFALAFLDPPEVGGLISEFCDVVFFIVLVILIHVIFVVSSRDGRGMEV